MTENKEMMTADEMRVPSGNAYDRQIEISIRRRSEYKTDGNTVSAHRDYVIGGKKYIVRSIFAIAGEKASRTESVTSSTRNMIRIRKFRRFSLDILTVRDMLVVQSDICMLCRSRSV